MLQNMQGLLCRVQNLAILSLDALLSHTDRSFEKVVHFVLGFEIPCVPLVPAGGNEFAAIQKTGLEKIGHRIGLVPNHHLKGVEQVIKRRVIFSDHVVAGEDEQISGRFEDSDEFRREHFGFDFHKIPLCKIIIDLAPPRERNISAAILSDIIWWVGQNQIDGVIGKFLHDFETVTVEQGQFSGHIYHR